MDSLLTGLSGNVDLLLVCATICVSIISLAVARLISNRACERTRRELAAYVAEGSMTADEAERILSAGRPTLCSGTRRGHPSPPPAGA